MGKEGAQRRGENGEKLVRRIIEEEATLGYRHLHDLLFETSRGKTSQLDHVLIDRFGVLLVETKCYGASLRGSSGEPRWTACYAGGKRHTLMNPLEQNELHRKRIHQVLKAQGMDLRESYVQSLVVFAEGDMKHLALSEVDQMRVTDLAGMRTFLRSRYDFQPNEGSLSEYVVDDLFGLMLRLDLSTDEHTMARHVVAARLAREGRRGGQRSTARRPERRSPSRPAARASDNPPRSLCDGIPPITLLAAAAFVAVLAAAIAFPAFIGLATAIFQP